MEAHRQLLIDSKVLLPNPQKATASEVDALLVSTILFQNILTYLEIGMIHQSLFTSMKGEFVIFSHRSSVVFNHLSIFI